jgi:hypothetical protein
MICVGQNVLWSVHGWTYSNVKSPHELVINVKIEIKMDVTMDMDMNRNKKTEKN